MLTQAGAQAGAQALSILSHAALACEILLLLFTDAKPSSWGGGDSSCPAWGVDCTTYHLNGIAYCSGTASFLPLALVITTENMPVS